MFLRKYGTGTGADVIIPIIKRGVVDFAVTADWTPAAGDVKVSKDGGTEANIATLPVINGTVGWKFVFSDAELQCKSLTVRVVDSATKAIEDQFFIVETYGNASAMFQADLSAANLPSNVVQISGDSTAADNLEAAADGTGYNLGAGQIVAASVSGAVGSVSGAVGSVTGNVGGDVVGSVASVLGAVGSVTGAVGSVTGNVGGNLDGNVSGNVSGSVGSVAGAVGSVTGSVGSVVGNVGGSVASVAGAVGSVTGNVGGDVAGKVLGGGAGTISGDGVRAASVTGAVGSVTGSVGSVVGAVELDSTTTTKIDSILEDTGTTLPALIDAIEGGGGSGTGARTVTITVNDGTTVLENAIVRMTEGVNTYTATTNASGVATFNLDDATYTVSISKSGYSYSGTTIIVNGTENATYSMTAVSVTPSSGTLTTGYLTCLDEAGAVEQGVAVRCQIVQVPTSGSGIAYDSAVQLATSGADGLVEFPMIKGARYLVWRGSIKPPAGIVPVLISASAGTTTALGSLIGE